MPVWCLERTRTISELWFCYTAKRKFLEMPWKNGGEGGSLMKQSSLKCRGPNMLKCTRKRVSNFFLRNSNYNFTLPFIQQNRKNCPFSMILIELRFFKTKRQKRFQFFLKIFRKRTEYILKARTANLIKIFLRRPPN